MKKLNILFAALLLAFGVQAEVLSPARALERVSKNGPARRMASRALKAEPMMTVANHGQEAELYVFTPSEGGLMIVSAESEAPALLGYSENYAAGETMPPALEMMLEAYAMEIEQIRSGNAKAAPQSRAEDYAAVETICRTQWNQGAPYNEALPLYNGAAPYVGCVPTALAQILKVYESPAQCSGKISYDWNGTTLSEDFSNYKPDWANMLDTYNGSKDPALNRKAVADLMKACGYACNTSFTTTASGTSTPQAAVGLVNNFGYDLTAVFLEQIWYPMDEWIKMVYDEVSAGHPVLYGGSNSRGGAHAFVADGFDGAGMFHINWGWSGASDGYYLLTALNPPVQGFGGSSAGYSLNMGAIFGIRPERITPVNDVAVHMFFTGGFKHNATSVPLGSMAFFSIDGRIINRCPITFNGVGSALKFVSVTDGKEYYAHCEAEYVSNVAPLYGLAFAPVTIPADLPQGKYMCYPAVWYKAADKCYPIHYPLDQADNYVTEANVVGQTLYFGALEAGEIKISDVDMPDEIQVNVPFYVKGNIENASSYDFTKSICLGLYKSGESVLLTNLGEVCSKASGKYTTEFDANVELTDETIASGTYDLAFYNADENKILSDRYSVKVVGAVEAESVKVTGFTCMSNARERLEFSITVKAGDSDFKDQVYVEIRENGQTSGGYIDRFQSSPVSIPAKQSLTFVVGDEFKDGVDGTTYVAKVLYYEGNTMTDMPGCEPLTFTLGEKTSINELSAGQVQTPLYDLSGRRVAVPAKGNIYIRNNRKIKL